MVYDERIWSEDYLIPGTYCQDGGTNTAGALTKWVRDTVFPDFAAIRQKAARRVCTMAALADEVPPARTGSSCSRTLRGSERRSTIRWHAASASGFCKAYAKHLYRAALEGVAYSVAQHVDILEENGNADQKLHVRRRGAQNRQWQQIIADVTGHTVKTAKVTIVPPTGTP
jgi:xylulokinase